LTRTAFLVAAILLSTVARADNTPITITINPEARLSVAITGAMPSKAPCGTPITLPVTIVNQGFVTARIDAALVDADPTVSLDFDAYSLKGLPLERRRLRLTLSKPGLLDITLAFREHNDIPDLGGRDRIHFLMRCLRQNTSGMGSAPGV
jgi:hypothetical protein